MKQWRFFVCLVVTVSPIFGLVGETRSAVPMVWESVVHWGNIRLILGLFGDNGKWKPLYLII